MFNKFKDKIKENIAISVLIGINVIIGVVGIICISVNTISKTKK